MFIGYLCLDHCDLFGIMIFSFVVSGVVAYFTFDWLLEKLLRETEEANQLQLSITASNCKGSNYVIDSVGSPSAGPG